MELRSHLKQQRELLTIKPINTGNRRKLKVNEINNLDSRIYPIWPIKEKQAACYEVLGNWKCKLKKKNLEIEYLAKRIHYKKKWKIWQKNLRDMRIDI